MDPFRGAGILAFVATMVRVTSLIPAQFDPATATWRVRATNHFDIYYTQARDLDAVAREAEQAYARVSRDLRRQVSARVPLILLPTSRDLPRTTQEAAGIVRASRAPDGVDHLLLPVEPRSGREKVLAHELTHIFEFDRGSRVSEGQSSGSLERALALRREDEQLHQLPHPEND